MKYIIMAGGTYNKWEKPRHLIEVNGEPLIVRTIRLLREYGVTDIAISTNSDYFDNLGVPILNHENTYIIPVEGDLKGAWLNAFYPVDEPVCYVFGDVFFSPEAIKTIVETETDSIQFFASAPPFTEEYIKPWAEPFAYKVVDTKRFFECIEKTKEYKEQGKFYRDPLAWELWQVIKNTELAVIDYTNYVVINDYTCDIDYPTDVANILAIIERLKNG